MNRNPSNRFRKPNDNRLYRASLASQQQAINDLMTDYAVLSVMFAVLTFVFLAWYWIENAMIQSGYLNKATPDMMILYVSAMCLVIFLCVFKPLIPILRIRRTLNNISAPTEETTTIYCTKVSFLYKLNYNDVLHSLIICVILKDRNRNQFCFVYPKNTAPFSSEEKQIKKALKGKDVTLICYKGTNIVKAFHT